MEIEKDYESSNIHLKWLEKIYTNLDNIENMEKIAREGCGSILEYLQIPPQLQKIMLGEVQYKNLRFLLIEMNMLIDNIEPIIKEKAEVFRKDIRLVSDNIENRNLFIKEVKSNGNTISVSTTPFFNKTVLLLSSTKTMIMKDIGHLLYLEDKGKPKW